MRRALILLAAAAVAVTGGGWLLAITWHLGYGQGLFCSLGTAATVGCNAVPRDAAGEAAAAAVIAVAIPLLAAVFALATSAHVTRRVRQHVDKRLAEHHQSIGRQMKAARAAPQRPRRRGGYAAAGLLVAALILMRRRGRAG